MRVLYTAAHAGFAKESVPLGGGAAVANQLIAEWSRTHPFDLEVIDPSILGSAAPTGSDTPPAGSGTPPAGGGSPKEPEPDFNKPTP